MEFPQSAGVYAFENVADAKLYVGSTRNLRRRISDHFQLLKAGRHHNPYLQRAFEKHGRAAFQTIILAVMPGAGADELTKEEQRWLDAFGVTDPANGYNIHPVASAAVSLDRPISDRLSAHLAGRKRGKRTAEQIAEHALRMRQRWADDNEKAYFGELMKARWSTDAHRDKIDAAWEQLKAELGELEAMRARLDANRRSPRRMESIKAYWQLHRATLAEQAGFGSISDLEAKLVETYSGGASVRAIASALGVSWSTVTNWLRRAGVTVVARGRGRRKIALSAANLAKAGHPDIAVFDAAVAVLYDDGHGVHPITRQMGVSADAVRRSLLRSGRTLHGHKAAHVAKHRSVPVTRQARGSLPLEGGRAGLRVSARDARGILKSMRRTASSTVHPGAVDWINSLPAPELSSEQKTAVTEMMLMWHTLYPLRPEPHPLKEQLSLF